MDTTKTTHLSLCSGYGGIDLGLRGAIPNLRTIAYAEIEAFACENLLARMEGGQLDPAPIWPDIKSFPWGAFSDRVDILSGGYPCQPFSAAGKRAGGEDQRHLWPFISSGIRILRPRICFFENVEGHITCGLHHVLCDLGRLGYRTTWGIFSARECGAPHQRKRVFILAHRDGERGQLSNWWRKSAEQMLVSNGKERGAWPSHPGQPQHGWEPPRVVADSASERTNGGHQLCDEECGQGRALPLQSDDSSEIVDNSSSAGLRAQRDQPISKWTERPFGQSSQLGDSSTERLQRSRVSGEMDSKSRGAEGKGSELAPASSITSDAHRGKGASVGDSEGGMPRQSSAGNWGEGAGGASETEWQAESTMGRNAYGTPHWMDYAELSVTCDNRTDELRLLGNGVVPATATLAFQTLLAELLNL